MNYPFTFDVATLGKADRTQLYRNISEPVPGGIVERDPARRDAALDLMDMLFTEVA